MLKSPLQRSRRLAFMKSSMKKFKSQFKLLEGNHGNADQRSTAREECIQDQEESARNSVYIPTNERLLYCMRLLYDDRSGWIEEELEEEVEIFYDCEEITASANSLIRSTLGTTTIVDAAVEEKATEELEEKKLGLHENDNAKSAAAAEMAMKERSSCTVRIFIIGVAFAAIGSYIGRRLYKCAEGHDACGAFFILG